MKAAAVRGFGEPLAIKDRADREARIVCDPGATR